MRGSKGEERRGGTFKSALCKVSGNTSAGSSGQDDETLTYRVWDEVRGRRERRGTGVRYRREAV